VEQNLQQKEEDEEKRRIKNGGKKHTVSDPTSSKVNILRLLDRSFSGLSQRFWH